MGLVQPDRLTPQARRQITDVFHRPLRSLRLSVTDRCNLRCQYCMPEEDYLWLPREDLLTCEEICTLVSVFTDLGGDKARLTGGEPLVPASRALGEEKVPRGGGEPLLRRDVPTLVRMLARNLQITDLALTTNGV